MTPRELFEANVAIIKRVVRDIARRKHLDADTCDELGGIVNLRLIENDYEILRQYRGHCAIRTYLTTVILNIYLDMRNGEWGKWRSSAAAKEMGDDAIKLEMLIVRDGFKFDEACEMLWTRGIARSRRELEEIFNRLPRRTPRRFVNDDVLEMVSVQYLDAEHMARAAQHRDTKRRAVASLHRALKRLPEDDRLLLKMRYFEGLNVANVSRGLHLPQKPLYRRLDQLRQRLRKDLLADGVDPDEILAAFETDDDGAGDE
jgi:RNA polymerase sigma factor (sigma-70 family)